MKYQSILVITYGRSGSTLLQGILNSIPGCLIRGENNNLIFHLYEAYCALLSARGMNGATPAKAWFGADKLDPQVFIESTATMVKGLLLADQADDQSISTYGLKEIRHLDIGNKLPDYLDFLRTIFPNPALIFLTRDLKEVVQSGWWIQRNPWKTERTLRSFEQQCSEYRNQRDGCFDIDYHDLTGKTLRLRQLFEFLGANYDLPTIDRVLAVPHSYAKERKLSLRQRVFNRLWRRWSRTFQH